MLASTLVLASGGGQRKKEQVVKVEVVGDEGFLCSEPANLIQGFLWPKSDMLRQIFGCGTRPGGLHHNARYCKTVPPIVCCGPRRRDTVDHLPFPLEDPAVRSFP